ncbi:MAG: RepB family DNA primase [Anaerolineae bacterium]|nr:RepB family DNA primase [Anaerolineae bacterium]
MTLTAIHPDGKHRTPSRHIPLHQPALLSDALDALWDANRQGWGAFVAVGLRKPGLSRWKRGGEADIRALPALFVDVDDPSPDTQAKLRALRPTPSCITFTGGGFHAYWWLDEPLADLELGRQLLRGLGRAAAGDHLSVAQSLRLPGSRNTKAGRNNARCRIVELHDTHYPVAAFDHLLPRQTTSQVAQLPRKTVVRASDGRLNPALLDAVTERLLALGYVRQGDWLSGPCLYPAHHRHDDAHPSFGFNTRTGYGHCFRCGSMLLKDMCDVLGIRGADYGGIFAQNELTIPVRH